MSCSPDAVGWFPAMGWLARPLLASYGAISSRVLW
jgi:hypothetical protein